MYRIEKTTPEFAIAPDMRWHVTDTTTGHVLAFRHTRREATEYARVQTQRATAATYARPVPADAPDLLAALDASIRAARKTSRR